MEGKTQIIQPTQILISQNNSEDIDLIALLRQLWSKRKLILKIIFLFLLLGFFIALSAPEKYTATCTVVPQSTKEGGTGGLGSLAALAGINLNALTTSGGTLSPVVYPQITKSLPFSREIMKTPIVVAKSRPDTISLYDFYTDKKYQPYSLLEVIKKYTLRLPVEFFSTFRKNRIKEVDWRNGDLLNMSVEEKKVYDIIQGSIQLSNNLKDGYVTLSYVFPEAEGAAQVTEQLRQKLEQYVKAFKIEKVESNLDFIEQNYKEARCDFLNKQAELAAFQDANRGLISATARTAEQRLQSEYDIAFTVYNELAKQREQAKISVKETAPILTTINPVVAPTNKSAPKRGIILITFLFIGVVFGIGWVLWVPSLKRIIKAINQ